MNANSNVQTKAIQFFSKSPQAIVVELKVALGFAFGLGLLPLATPLLVGREGGSGLSVKLCQKIKAMSCIDT